MRLRFFLSCFLLPLLFSLQSVQAQPPEAAPTPELTPEPADFQSAVIGTWMETWTVIGTDTSSVVNLEGKETYWTFKEDGTFITGARWAFSKTPLMIFGEYQYSFDGGSLLWDNEPSGWEVTEVRENYLIMPARFIGEQEGQSVWKKVDTIEIEE